MPQIELYPAIVGVFIHIDVNTFFAPPQGPLLDLDIDMSNAKLLVFQTSKHTYNMFISGGPDNEALLTCKEDALVWDISPFGLQYCVQFTNISAMEKFSYLHIIITSLLLESALILIPQPFFDYQHLCLSSSQGTPSGGGCGTGRSKTSFAISPAQVQTKEKQRGGTTVCYSLIPYFQISCHVQNRWPLYCTQVQRNVPSGGDASVLNGHGLSWDQKKTCEITLDINRGTLRFWVGDRSVETGEGGYPCSSSQAQSFQLLDSWVTFMRLIIGPDRTGLHPAAEARGNICESMGLLRMHVVGTGHLEVTGPTEASKGSQKIKCTITIYPMAMPVGGAQCPQI
ncbi:hypothetical protein H4582DRAFT_2059514 [Lactarius indigo]|nr:hypothetical protein H4582DRAFT_2059514 [Lactarius indigo]